MEISMGIYREPNLEVIRLWAAELLSDRVHQGQEWLGYYLVDPARSGEAVKTGPLLNCCLGVLCELAIAAGVPVHREEVFQAVDDMIIVEYDGQRDFLPDSVKDWAGLPRNPYLEVTGFTSIRTSLSASSLNDGEGGLTFSEIAQAIKDTFNLEEPDAQTH